MPFSVQPMDAVAAAAIATWRYDGPYAFYDADPQMAPYLLEPQHAYYAVWAAPGDLAGFCCFGGEAQVPGGHQRGLYARDAALDFGLGMRPDLTGQGQGLRFVQAGLAFGQRHFAPARFRLSVATFNARAIRVYTQAGFEPSEVFPSPTPAGEVLFLLMLRPAITAGELAQWVR
ncbi:MAG TPA: GNAT family protein [Chloroflexia bacterium]|nr:GNAT family protein [Chloroflexia bacterium]